MSIKSFIKEKVTSYCDGKYQKALAGKQVSFDEWIREKEKDLERYDMSVEVYGSDISPKDFSSLSYSTRYKAASVRIVPFSKVGEGFSIKHYIEDVIIFVNGELTDKAIPLITRVFENNHEAEIVYGNEDIAEIDENDTLKYGRSVYGTRRNPFFKPAWSPNAFLDHFYFCNVVAIRRNAFREDEWAKDSYGARALYETLLLHIFDKPAYNSKAVVFVDEILVHASEYSNNDIRSERSFSDNVQSELSVVIPSKDNPELLESAIASFLNCAKGITCEFIVVDNGSQEENRKKISDALKKYKATYIYEPMEFNFAKQCNIGVAKAKYSNVLLLNDDITFETKLSIRTCMEQLAYSFTGAVGLKLLYPDSNRIQHAGVVNNTIGPVHKLQFCDDEKEYYFGYNRYVNNVSAVTAACLFVRKEAYEKVGGMDESLKVAFNDVDFCFRLLEAGYVNVCCNNVSAIHCESVTRGKDTGIDSLIRLNSEKEKLYNTHINLRAFDPYYSKYLLKDCLDSRIVPANEYETKRYETVNRTLRRIDISKAREDECVVLSLEYAAKKSGFTYNEEDSEKLLFQGFAYIIGSDNACYLRELLLFAEDGCFSMPCEGVLRNDVAEALEDQVNVGLSGFSFSCDKSLIPSGRYRVGILFSKKFSGEKIYVFSNKFVVVK